MANLSAYSVNNNYIFYKRILDENQRGVLGNYWPRLGEQVKQELNSTLTATKNFTWGDVAAHLHQVAYAERTKEENFLKQVFNIDKFPGGTEYIKLVNDCIGLGEAAREVVTELNMQTSDTKAHAAPTAFAYFEEYLTTAINQVFSHGKVREKLSRLIAKENTSELDEYIDELIHRAVTRALEESFERRGKYDKTITPFIGLEKAITPFMRKYSDQFISILRSYYNLDGAIDSIKSYLQNENSGVGNFNTFRQAVSASLTISSKNTRTGQGYLEEMLPAFVSNSILQNTAHDKHIKINSSTTVLPSNMMKTDSITLYSNNVNLSIDTSKLIQGVSSQVIKSLTDATQIFNNFAETFSKEQKKFVVFTNAKNYSLRAKKEEELGPIWKGFSSGQKVAIMNYDNNLTNIDIASIRQVLMNTAPGTLLEDKRSEAKEIIIRYLTALTANTLFDDWVAIGEQQTSTNAIHMFQLDEIQVPLSYFCEGIADAIDKTQQEIKIRAASSWMSISVEQPKRILYEQPKDSTAEIIGGLQNGHHAVNLNDLWNKQREDSMAKTKFHAYFMYNFKDIIKEMVATYN